MRDTYYTIASTSKEILFKDRNSKFYGIAYPVDNETEIKARLRLLKKQHHQAGHFCYAWVLGNAYERHRANDDGEPSNSAGTPILRQLQSYDLTNTLVVVVRYFGGKKLGVSGLINAYRSAAKMAIEESVIIEKTIEVLIPITFEYPLLNKVMRFIKEHSLEIKSQKMETNCRFLISVRKKESEKIVNLLRSFYGIKIIKK